MVTFQNCHEIHYTIKHDSLRCHKKTENYRYKEGTYPAVLYCILKSLELVKDKTSFCWQDSWKLNLKIKEYHL